MPPAEIEAHVALVFATLPKDIRRALADVTIAINETEAPQTPAGRGIDGAWHPASRVIILYARALADADVATVTRVLRHEIGHACGMDHARLDALGL